MAVVFRLKALLYGRQMRLVADRGQKAHHHKHDAKDN